MMWCGLLTLFCYLVASASAWEWPKQYSTEGNIILPYGGINEPFKAVVDMNKGMSYFNTYNGKVRTIVVIV